MRRSEDFQVNESRRARTAVGGELPVEPGAVMSYDSDAAIGQQLNDTLETASKTASQRLAPFPDSPRVVYRKNPLEEVVCQLKFPPILRIESEPPASFQDQISDEYPILEDNPVQQLNLPPAVARILSGELIGAAPNRQFQFASADGMWKLVLNREFVALSTNQYKRWEDFSSRLQRALTALESQYKPPAFFVRIGLRYRNVIKRSEFGGPDERWSRLLTPHILGELADERVEPSILQAARQTVISLGERGAQVRLIHGLAVPPEQGEICYSIDSDLFTEERTEIANAFDVLKIFNRQAGRLFRWCITEHLHDALGPEVVI
jgi:uncharacterized protein (TIGR04255 family)